MAGIKIRDSQTGQVVVDITDRLTRHIGTVNSGASPGSVNVPDFALSPGWATVIEAPRPSPNLFQRYRIPLITVTTTGFSWLFISTSDPILPCDIVYGVY